MPDRTDWQAVCMWAAANSEANLRIEVAANAAGSGSRVGRAAMALRFAITVQLGIVND
jgi:hypothetical protein